MTRLAIQTLDFAVIGGAKSGTTALYDMMSQIESVSLPRKKDFHFFDYDEVYNNGFDWYWAHFDCSDKAEVRGEVAANYLYSETALRRLKAVNSEMKIIVVLRDPVDRLVSEYQHHYRNGVLTESLTSYLSDPNIKSKHVRYTPWHLLVERSCYSRWLDLVYTFFGERQIKIIKSSDLNEKSSATLADICDFLGATNEVVQEKQSNRHYSPKSILLNRLIRNDTLRAIGKIIFPFFGLRQKVRRMIRKINTGPAITLVTDDERQQALNILNEANEEY